MCEPTTIIAIGSAVIGYIGQQQQAKAQDRAIQANQEQQAEQTKVAQWQAYGQSAEQQSQRAKEARLERGRLKVIGAESGIAGNTADRIMAESEFNAGQDITSIQRNSRNTQQQLDQQQKGIRTKAQGQFNTVERPSALGTGLQIAGDYAAYKAKQPTPKTPTDATDNAYAGTYGYGPKYTKQIYD